MVSRYGDYVLYDPPFKATTVLLWVGPFVLLVGGLIGYGIDWLFGTLPHELFFETEQELRTYLEGINSNPVVDTLDRWVFFNLHGV